MTTYNQIVIKHKVGLLNLAEELGSISKACKMMGYSRDTFYRYQAAKEEGGVEALLDKSRRKPNLKNRVEKEVEDAVVAFTTSYQAHGQTRTNNELRKKEFLFPLLEFVLSGSCMACIILNCGSQLLRSSLRKKEPCLPKHR